MKEGDKRTEIKFAYLPIKIDVGKYVWLEKYLQTYEYLREYYETPFLYHEEGERFNNYRYAWVKKERKML